MTTMASLFKPMRFVALMGALLVLSWATWASVHPTVAQASGCVFTNGTTSNLALGASGIHPVGGTIVVKPSSSCHDLNLSYVSATDRYAGFLERSNGTWFECSRGFVSISAGHHSTTDPPVLCSDVLTGTHMAVVQASNTRRSITIED